MPINRRAPAGKLKVGAILYPRVSNTEDLAPLLAEPDVDLTWLSDPALVLEQDLLILPGTKSTVGDLVYLTATSMAEAIRAAAERGAWILGLCGGYQMLGKGLHDRAGSEGGPSGFAGLDLLPLTTTFEPEKIVHQSETESLWPKPGHALAGYEIHHGRTVLCAAQGEALVRGEAALGWRHGRVLGAYLHGILSSDGWRSDFLNQIRESRSLPALAPQTCESIELRLGRWAEHVRTHLRPGAWERILAAVTP
jgi:adenosylcobyric acid synthase